MGPDTNDRKLLPLVSVFVAIFGAGVTLSSVHADPPKPCAKATYETAGLQAACKSGGLDAAKKYMKGLVDKAKAAGSSTKCNDCHTNLKTYELTPNAKTDLKPLL